MKKTVIVLGSIVGVLLVAVVIMFAFGKPTAAPMPQPGPLAASSSTQGNAGSMGDVPVTGTEAPAPDPSTPLAIEIPGCVCHSDDPQVVKEHEQYRMNQCAGCHAGGVPTGQ